MKMRLDKKQRKSHIELQDIRKVFEGLKAKDHIASFTQVKDKKACLYNKKITAYEMCIDYQHKFNRTIHIYFYPGKFNENSTMAGGNSCDAWVAIAPYCTLKALRQELYSIVKSNIRGFVAELNFYNDMITLVKNDREVGKMFGQPEKTKPQEDKGGVDFFLPLKKGLRLKIPFQIKSDEFGFNKHAKKDSHHKIACILFDRQLLKSGFLKKMLLQIGESYLRNFYCEHLKLAA